MKKIILAISGIFCLQLVFIAHNLRDPTAETSFVRTDDEASRVLAETSADSPLDGDAELAELDYLSFVGESLDLESEPVAPRSVRAVSLPERDVPRRPFRQPIRNAFVENAAAIRPVKIEYKIYNAVAFKQQPPSRSMRTEYPRVADASLEREQLQASAKMGLAKKKGFFSKAFPIIKKPYDWLKAVGSTLK